MYLFELKNGKQKLAYGQSPEDALEILAMRLPEPEMREVQREVYPSFAAQLQQYVHNLG